MRARLPVVVLITILLMLLSAFWLEGTPQRVIMLAGIFCVLWSVELDRRWRRPQHSTAAFAIKSIFGPLGIVLVLLPASHPASRLLMTWAAVICAADMLGKPASDSRGNNGPAA